MRPLLLCLLCSGCLIVGDRDAGMKVTPPVAASCVPGGMPCQGCCDSAGACQPGNLALVCGQLGVACEACASDTFCRSDNGCTTDPASLWRVQPYSATVSSTNHGAPWDSDGSGPDVFVSLYCPLSENAETAHTQTVSDNFTPSWTGTSADCVMTARDLIHTGFGVAVFDDDAPAVEVITPKTSVKLDDSKFDVGYVRATSNGPLQELWFTLKRQ